MTKLTILPVALIATATVVGCNDTPTQPTEGPLSATYATQSAPVRNSDVMALPFFVVDGNGVAIDPATHDASTALYDARAYANGDGLVPVTAPDGRQVTWGEFTAVRGEIAVKCIPQGTHVQVSLSNLIPNGVYTIWNVTFNEDGFQVPHPLTLAPSFIGVGPSGPNDGSRNTVRASASGRASISTITPAGPLGTFGQIGGCALTDEYEWHVTGLYHMDGKSYGPNLGPIGTMAEHFAFIVVNGQ